MAAPPPRPERPELDQDSRVSTCCSRCSSSQRLTCEADGTSDGGGGSRRDGVLGGEGSG